MYDNFYDLYIPYNQAYKITSKDYCRVYEDWGK